MDLWEYWILPHQESCSDLEYYKYYDACNTFSKLSGYFTGNLFSKNRLIQTHIHTYEMRERENPFFNMDSHYPYFSLYALI